MAPAGIHFFAWFSTQKITSPGLYLLLIVIFPLPPITMQLPHKMRQHLQCGGFMNMTGRIIFFYSHRPILLYIFYEAFFSAQ